MCGIVILFLQVGKNFLHLRNIFDRIGKGKELTAFFFVQSLAGTFDCKVAVCHKTIHLSAQHGDNSLKR